MNFPLEWDSLDMYPDELFEGQVSLYELGDERGSEHYRNGAFHWWLRRQPSKVQLENLLRLAALDPDPLMGEDVRQYIQRSVLFDAELAALDAKLFPGR